LFSTTPAIAAIKIIPGSVSDFDITAPHPYTESTSEPSSLSSTNRYAYSDKGTAGTTLREHLRLWFQGSPFSIFFNASGIEVGRRLRLFKEFRKKISAFS
jgi:hypothetical protein